MIKKTRRLILFLGGGLISILMAACSSQTLQELTPEEIVMKSAQRMQDVPGYQFILQSSGAPTFLDEMGTSFRRAEGSFVQPDSIRATIKVMAFGVVADIELISIGEEQWQTNFLTQAWEVAPEGSFSPAVLFDTESGIPTALEFDITELEQVESIEIDELPGMEFYTLTGKLDGMRAFEMSFGLIGPEPLDITLWIAPDTFELYRLIVIEPGAGEDEGTTWQFDFWGFDQVEEIQPPME